MRKILLTLSLLSVSAFSAPTASAPVSGPPPARSAGEGSGLDTAQVRKFYQDGDFDRAIPILEALLRSKRPLNHGDSVFVLKHLGVMYAASETTRERGKYHMLQLLHIEPTARIMDMYASDMIYMIFRNIQEEFVTAQTKQQRIESRRAGNQIEPRTDEPVTPPARKPPAKTVSNRKTYYWIGAVTLMAGVGAATYVLTQNQPVTAKPHQVD